MQVLNDLGTCYEIKNDHQEAISYFERAFEINPLPVRKNLVAAYFNSGALDKAFNLSISDKFDKPVFLEELLRAKAMKISNLQNDTLLKTYINEKVKKEGWLIDTYQRSKTSKRSFEELLISRSKNEIKY